MKRIILITILLIPILYGCKKDPDRVPDEYTFDKRARDGLYDLMKVYYLWSDKMPTVKLSDYSGPAELLEAVRYLPVDKWSFVIPWEKYVAVYEQGSFVGHGILTALDAQNNLRIVHIYERSDLWSKGVRRGWIIKKVNGTDAAPVYISGDAAAYNALWGPSTADITNTILFQKPDGTEVTLPSTKASFILNTVTADTVYERSGRKIAYFVFENFLGTAEEELDAVFASFKQKGATDLIVDLRYNGGGYVDVAAQLASLIAGNSYTDKVCYKIRANSIIGPDWNEDYNFITTASPLDLAKAVFITTDGSASASELVINSLKPYIDVSIVGDNTYGKPAGQSIFGYPFPTTSVPEPDETYAYGIIAFEYLNSLNEGRFYDGIAPDVRANDDLTRDYGDTEEISLKAALAVIEGTKSGPAMPFRRNTIWSEKNETPLLLMPVHSITEKK
ncbi:MAG: hypothetical protein IH592_05505 [Bacteroidales bacterium]|nr:hypothetical protein [Bacteroidales bacterium]